MTFHLSLFRSAALSLILLGAAGCAGRPSILPNPDSSLRKTSAQFAADAAKRHPYKADAPRGGQAPARAMVGYMLDTVELANLSDADFDNIEVWVNKNYVCFVPKVEKGAARTAKINFQMLFDDSGNSFPTDNNKTLVNTVELYMNGKMYDVVTKLAD